MASVISDLIKSSIESSSVEDLKFMAGRHADGPGAIFLKVVRDKQEINVSEARFYIYKAIGEILKKSADGVKPYLDEIISYLDAAKAAESMKYAYYYALIESLHENDAALDIVCDSMIRLIGEEKIDPVEGTRLIYSIWPQLGYPDYLNEFVGLEGDIVDLENELADYDEGDFKFSLTESKIAAVREKIRELARAYTSQFGQA